MDCRTALEILEVVRPDTGDLDDPELAEAAAHIESHAECKSEFLRRQQLDREIGSAMRDIPVPHDLETRLLADLAERSETADVAETVAAPTAKPKAALQRRSWMSLVVGTAASLAIGVIGWQLLSGSSTHVDAVQVATSITGRDPNFDGLTEYGGDDSELPADWESLPKGLAIDGPKSYAYQQADGAKLAIAMYQFRFTHRRTPVTGYLLVLPVDSVNPPPTNTALPAGAGSGITSVSWTDGDFVYVCVIPKRGGHFRRLGRLLDRGMT
ncbi:MAG: hypothetical protein HON53_12065 [Planctomycetaceae bacterium]|nr:hypothetical protein [Planctomycetaceae bacterium]MBT6154907.1 hypothetical protein [Planctomycetaceae bacterium]MBT6485974.1 hypothetical protein [Planctomycetaceae bacterium]MBT6497054.1 hypothetical protein [Planctomycetaceae bacterium]